MGQELKQSIIRSVRLAVGSMQKFAQSHWNQSNTEAEVCIISCSLPYFDYCRAGGIN